MSRDGDSYLEIAETVLKRTRMPLSARQIINLAYVQSLVYSHLYGSTQHKTMGARLSEDILEHREKSKFFRTRPGRFFLTEFISDHALPIEFRNPVVARRRRRMLSSKNIAAIPQGVIHHYLRSDDQGFMSPSELSEIINTGLITYADKQNLASRALYPIHTFALLKSDLGYLTYARRRYADPMLARSNQHSVGFTSPLVHDDLTLFDMEDHGAVISALSSVSMDLDLEYSRYLPYFETSSNLVGCYLVPTLEEYRFTLLAIVEVEAPADFLPIGKRLSVGNMSWRTFSEIVDSPLVYDDWSRYLFNESRQIWDRLGRYGQPDLLF